MSTTQVRELEGAVRPLDEALNLCLRLRELPRGRAHALDTLLEQREGPRQFQLVARQLGHDRLEPPNGLLERHRAGAPGVAERVTNSWGLPGSRESGRAVT